MTTARKPPEHIPVPPAPPAQIIEAAIAAAQRSPCGKSKRGAVVFNPDGPDYFVFGTGWNGQPAPLACTGDARCQAACGKLCVHAEARALRGIGPAIARGLELVHAKVVDGQLVAGGGPSCWQCSREILDVGIAAVWLYQLPTVAEANAAGVTDMYDPRFPGLARWRRYAAGDFHRATLVACGLLAGEEVSRGK